MKLYLSTINDDKGQPVEHFATAKERNEHFNKTPNLKESQKGGRFLEIKGINTIEELIQTIVK